MNFYLIFNSAKQYNLETWQESQLIGACHFDLLLQYLPTNPTYSEQARVLEILRRSLQDSQHLLFTKKGNTVHDFIVNIHVFMMFVHKIVNNVLAFVIKSQLRLRELVLLCVGSDFLHVESESYYNSTRISLESHLNHPFRIQISIW